MLSTPEMLSSSEESYVCGINVLLMVQWADVPSVFHLALLVSAALQIRQTREALVGREGQDALPELWRKVRPFVVVAPCVIGVSWLGMIFWIRQLYNEFGCVLLRIGAPESLFDRLLVGPFSMWSAPIHA